MSYKEILAPFKAGDKVCLRFAMVKNIGSTVGIFSKGHKFVVKGLYPSGRNKDTSWTGTLYPMEGEEHDLEWAYNLMDAETPELPESKRHFVTVLGRHIKLVESKTEPKKEIKESSKTKPKKEENKDKPSFGLNLKKGR